MVLLRCRAADLFDDRCSGHLRQSGAKKRYVGPDRVQKNARTRLAVSRLLCAGGWGPRREGSFACGHSRRDGVVSAMSSF